MIVCRTLNNCYFIGREMPLRMIKDILHVQTGCSEFNSILNHVKRLVESESSQNTFFERIGIVTRSNLFRVDTCDEHVDAKVKNAKILTIVAQIFNSEHKLPLKNFEALARVCVNEMPNDSSKRKKQNVNSKYRSIDGRGNNVKHPEWGATDTPFSRYASSNFEDGIYTIKKSVTGSELPNARQIVQEVMLKAVRSPPPAVQYNLMGLLIIVFATHDLHYQVPMQMKCSDSGIRCCSKGNHHTLPADLSHSACLPIKISDDDPFFKKANIGCMNMVRSQIGSYHKGVETGNTLNRATAYLDLSLIYGNYESELKPIRLNKGGKLRMGKNNLLPVDANGKYLPSMDRFVVTPISSIWPVLFARNHNHLAERLAKLKPNWDDETLFQEARRINIANFQFNLITAKSIEKVFNKVVDVSYSDERNAATLIEFPFTYRGGHYYVPSHMVFQDENNVETKYLQSDTIRKIELLENDFDAALRGAINQPVNVGEYSDEIINRIGKNSDGYGMDLISTDIQRGRDHGIPSFVQIRRECKLTPEINSFDDFNKIFNKANVDLLKKVYKSYEDVDFYVGGLLEAFESVGNPFAGPTFGCIIGANYNNVMGGDRYFYTHPENPHPFTKAQIDAVRSYQIPHIFCTNSGLNETNKIWSYINNPTNPKVDCKNYPPMDLSAWK
ncbi:Peroxidase [Pseudolycoriella hygida]|uniref:Peroxidase n=1 Tax=Pseudolycoriella hygida TaxID=35572 RepID=A0A9Q0MLN8_9DIPT|nr:Peroxidase [Pseudolycoriella hygida]